MLLSRQVLFASAALICTSVNSFSAPGDKEWMEDDAPASVAAQPTVPTYEQQVESLRKEYQPILWKETKFRAFRRISEFFQANKDKPNVQRALKEVLKDEYFESWCDSFCPRGTISPYDELKNSPFVSNMRITIAPEFLEKKSTSEFMENLANQPLAHLQNVRIRLWESKIPLSALENILRIPQLRRLELVGAKNGDELAFGLKGTSPLQELQLDGSCFTHRGLKAMIEHFPDLKEISLANIKATEDEREIEYKSDSLFSSLENLRRLEKIDLSRNSFTTTYLSALVTLPNLNTLYLHSMWISQEDIRWVEEAPNLKRVELHSMGLSDHKLDPKKYIVFYPPDRDSDSSDSDSDSDSD